MVRPCFHIFFRSPCCTDVSSSSCRKFIARKTLRSATFFLLNDLFKSLTAASPYGSWKDIAHIKRPVSFASAPFWTRFGYAWAHIILAYTGLEMANAAYGVVSVATGLSNPRDCPSAFGDLKGLVSVREAWSYVLHTLLLFNQCFSPW
jgi:hypothetical protein